MMRLEGRKTQWIYISIELIILYWNDRCCLDFVHLHKYICTFRYIIIIATCTVAHTDMYWCLQITIAIIELNFLNDVNCFLSCKGFHFNFLFDLWISERIGFEILKYNLLVDWTTFHSEIRIIGRLLNSIFKCSNLLSFCLIAFGMQGNC